MNLNTHEPERRMRFGRRFALELATHNNVYEDIATKFFEHFLHIVEAMNNIGE
jgi:hypothetical protein